MERRPSHVAPPGRAILASLAMGLPLLTLWLAGLGAASGTVDGPASPAAGVVLLSRRDWRAQEARLVESLHIYIRDLNLTIETHLIPREAQSPEEQGRFADLRCEPEVVMVFWFGQDESGPGLTTLRCEPREVRMLPLPADASQKRDLDVVAHGLALKLRAMLVGPPREPQVAARAEASTTAPPGPPLPPTTNVARPSPAAMPPTNVARPSPAATPPATAARPSPAATLPTTAARPVPSSPQEPPPSAPPAEEPASAAATPSLPTETAVAARAATSADTASPARLVGLRGFGSLANGQRADGLGVALVLGSLWRRHGAELALAAAQLQGKERASTDTAPALTWWVASAHLAWSARGHVGGLGLESGLLVGASRFALSASGPAERAGTRAAWTADVGLQALARWPLGEHLAADASLAVVLGLPRQRFTLDGVTEADGGLVRARASVGIAYLF